MRMDTLPLILDALQRSVAKAVPDIGCGDGRLARAPWISTFHGPDEFAK